MWQNNTNSSSVDPIKSSAFKVDLGSKLQGIEQKTEILKYVGE